MAKAIRKETTARVKKGGRTTIKEAVKSSKKAGLKTAKSAVKKKPLKTAEKISKVREKIRGLKKTYLKSASCKVTFLLPKEAAPEAKKVTIVGDFNNWSYTESEMKKMKTGDFKLTLELAGSREYRFKYLIDSCKWENDWFADKYIPSPFGGDDSVIVI